MIRCLWFFVVRGAACRIFGGIGRNAFEARAEAADFWGLEPSELVALAYDSRIGG